MGRLAMIRQYGLRSSIFLANFTASKGIAFASPLAVAGLVSSATYGAVETALATASLVVAVATLGVPSAVPVKMLAPIPARVEDILSASVLWTIFLGVLAGGVNLILGGRLVWTLSGFAIAGAAIQQAATVYLRCASRRNAAAWIENFSTHSLLAVVFALIVLGGCTLRSITFCAGLLAIGMGGLVAYSVKRFLQPRFQSRLVDAMMTGWPLTVSGLFSFWVASSGRVLISALISTDAAAHYAFAFRVAGALVIIHQIVNTGLFARLYQLEVERFDRIIGAYFAGIACFGLVVIAIVHHFAGRFHFGSQTLVDLKQSAELFPIVMLQMFAIVVYGALEMRVTRTGTARYLLLPYLYISVATFFVAVLLSRAGMLNGSTLIYLVALQTVAGAAFQFRILGRTGEKLPIAASTSAAAALVLAVVSFIF